MIPLKDYNPTRRPAIVTLVLIAACIGVYFFVQNHGVVDGIRGPVDQGELDAETRFTFRRAAIPCELVTSEPLSVREIATGRCIRGGDPVFDDKSPWLAVLTSIFLHGNFLHLAGNMLYLWVFGNNIEDHAGPLKYLAFYIGAGIVATGAHVLIDPSSTVPVVGASGAIAGVMGAYMVLFPRVPIRSLIVFFVIFLRDIEARWLLGFWFVSQFFVNPNAGVAWAAHVGGFAFGVVVALIWRARRPPVPRGLAPLGPDAAGWPARPRW